MNILICSSSKNEIDKKYLIIAEEVCEKLKKHNLIFGAASTGMMGICTKCFQNIYSYTTKKYVEDLKNIKSTEEFILDTTFDRTKEMYLKADTIIVLPGGSGTYSEIFSILEENRSTNNPKRFIIFNYENYYDKFLEIIDDLVDKKFNTKEIYNYFKVAHSVDELIDMTIDKQ